MARNDTPDPTTITAPEHGTVVRYQMPGVVSVTVGYGIDPDTHRQVASDATDAVTVEPRPQAVKAAKPVRKVITADTEGVETA